MHYIAWSSQYSNDTNLCKDDNIEAQKDVTTRYTRGYYTAPSYLTTVALSLYYDLPKSQINRLQQIQKSLAHHAVVKAPEFTDTTSQISSLS